VNGAMGREIAPAAESGGSIRTRMSSAAGIPGSDSCCPDLTLQQRIMGCLSCLAIGFAISFVGFLAWWTGHIASFGILYTTGNIVSICGTGFLIGPRRQVRNMFAAKRVYATAIYFTMMILTLAAAFIGVHKLLVLIFCALQWCAAVWYVASYIPFGQKMITKFFSTVTAF